MKALTHALALVSFAALTAPVFAQNISIDYDHTVNFLKFKTYSWGKIHATDPSVEDRITIAMKRDMAGRYMTEVGSNSDITITTVEATKDKQEFAPAFLIRRPRLPMFPSTPSSSTCTTQRPTSCSGAAPSRSPRPQARTRTISASTRLSRN